MKINTEYICMTKAISFFEYLWILMYSLVFAFLVRNAFYTLPDSSVTSYCSSYSSNYNISLCIYTLW